MTRADITNVTHEAHAFCTALWDKLGLTDTQPFQPARLGGPSLFMPGNVGGVGGVWGGVSTDPRTGAIFVNTTNLPAYGTIVPAAKDDPLGGGGYKIINAYIKFQDANGMPCVAPPWGEMIAVNGNTGGILWRRPLGEAEVYGGVHTGGVTMGGSLATAGGLVFIGGTGINYFGARIGQPVFRAYDSRSGAELWRVRLSSPAQANPMSFVGKGGRQYVVVAESGVKPAEAEVALLAFALPRPGDVPVDLKPAPLPAAKSD